MHSKLSINYVSNSEKGNLRDKCIMKILIRIAVFDIIKKRVIRWRILKGKVKWENLQDI